MCHREKCSCRDEKNTDAFQRLVKAPNVKELISVHMYIIMYNNCASCLETIQQLMSEIILRDQPVECLHHTLCHYSTKLGEEGRDKRTNDR